MDAKRVLKKFSHRSVDVVVYARLMKHKKAFLSWCFKF